MTLAEGYRSFSNEVLIHDVMNEVMDLFKIDIKNLGFAVRKPFEEKFQPSTHWQLRRDICRRAEVEFGQKERWVQALPFAVIEHNQRPHKVFDFLLSPFEVNSLSEDPQVMFGRKPWRGNEQPPWCGMYDPEGQILEDTSGKPRREVSSPNPTSRSEVHRKPGGTSAASSRVE